MTYKEFNAQHLDELSQLGAKYAQGIRSASRKLLSEEVFHKDAIIYGTVLGSFMGGPIEKLYQLVDGRSESSNMTYHVDVVDATPTTGVLRVHLDNLVTGVSYIDLLSAVKIDGKWRIVCKVLQEYESKN
ncbi:hypothetical protein PHYBOEH_005479 [Phytophthora boehmeriae]|uniref:Lumazine-binding protein n=1 Tax=Phytophthora boehmeriae TaxID=109152 RepID=A0A8T1WP07_9STRA|nr:hypothetical protein PHYBOEH_005479 [Phytophthora boehmeriae]